MSRERARSALNGEKAGGVARYCDLWDPELVRRLGGVGEGPLPRYRALRSIGADMTRSPAGYSMPLPPDPEDALRELVSRREEFERDREAAGDDILVLLAFPHSILGPAMHRNGAWDFLATLASSPHDAASRLEKEAIICLQVAEILASWPGLEAVLFMDDLAGNRGPLVSPQTLKTLYFPRIREIFAPLAEASITVLFHSDGDLTSLNRDILACGAKGHHPVEPVGNWSLRTAALSDNVVIVGNASLALLASSREQAAAERRRCEEFAAEHAAYFMAPAAEVGPETPIENLLAFFE